MTNYEGPPQWPHGGKFELAPGGGAFGDVYDGLGRVLGCWGFYIYQYFRVFPAFPFAWFVLVRGNLREQTIKCCYRIDCDMPKAWPRTGRRAS